MLLNADSCGFAMKPTSSLVRSRTSSCALFIQPLTPPSPTTTTAADSSVRVTRQVDGPWPPEPGHRLTWPSRSGELGWVVERVDLRSGEVELVGELFGTTQHCKANLREVEPLPITITHEYRVEDDADDDQDAEEVTPSAREEPLEKDERAALERTVDRLIFSEEALRQYHRDYAVGVAWERAAGSLDRLLRKNGRLIRKYRGEYLRIRTRHFDVRVIKRPIDEQPFLVKRLNPHGAVPRPSHRTKQGRRSHRPSCGRQK